MNEEKKSVPRATAFCPICGEPTEREFDMPLFDGSGKTEKRRVHIFCDCELKKSQQIEERLAWEETKRKVDSLRQLSMMDTRLKNATFANYQVTSDNARGIAVAKRFVNQFDRMCEDGRGLLLYGGVGTGKSYTAAAIANSLLEKMRPVIMTSFIRLLEEMSGYESNAAYLARLNQAQLLIIDDLGAERGSDYALEKVYDIVDSRYRSKKPMILTTNLDPQGMQSCSDIRYARIYDRIFESCYPVQFTGASWRKREAAVRYFEMQKIMEG